MLAFGLVGFFGGKVGMDTGAMALGVILGPMIEENLGKSVDLSRSVDGGLMSVMFEGSINKVLIAALLLSLLTPFLLKLRNRNLGPLLDANGWAVNTRARINIPFGAALTGVATLPAGAKRSLSDPYAEKQTPWGSWMFLLIVVVIAIVLWRQGAYDSFLG